MATTPVARRYARALYEIGAELKNLDKLNEQLSALGRNYSASRELRNVLLNPSVKLEERRQIVRSLGQKSSWEPVLTNFSLLLMDKDRFRQVAAIAEEFQRLVDEGKGNVRAQVTSASDLSLVQKEQLKKAITTMTGKTVLLETTVDATLIGGAVTRVGSVVYDGSVRTQLEKMREAILKEVN
ncbi:MAG: ATP synthase F1 subunit delta [Bradymonadaceae bacterium]|nr:ATP synthase F1 subunit delta [Lujinxingiaceae bacterium]